MALSRQNIILICIALTLIALGIGQGINERPIKPPPTPSSIQEGGTRAARESGVVIINGHQLNLELATTPEARARGLSGRARLAPDAGLLFIFATPAQPGFWMKGMNFALAIIW